MGPLLSLGQACIDVMSQENITFKLQFGRAVA